jgi:FtsP/CotA-like multicopper oxidase with cupredoxin domain
MSTVRPVSTRTAVHCHIAEHHESGTGLRFEVEAMAGPLLNSRR